MPDLFLVLKVLSLYIRFYRQFLCMSYLRFEDHRPWVSVEYAGVLVKIFMASKVFRLWFRISLAYLYFQVNQNLTIDLEMQQYHYGSHLIYCYVVNSVARNLFLEAGARLNPICYLSYTIELSQCLSCVFNRLISALFSKSVFQ